MRLIDADALIEHMRKAYNKRISDWDLISTVAVIGAEEDAKPIRHGHWMKENEEDTFVCVFKCSLCGDMVLTDRVHLFKYCPHCGAKMDEVEEDEIN